SPWLLLAPRPVSPYQETGGPILLGPPLRCCLPEEAAAALDAVIGRARPVVEQDAAGFAVGRLREQPRLRALRVLVVRRDVEAPRRKRNTNAREPQPTPLEQRRREVGGVGAQVLARPAGVVAVVG